GALRERAAVEPLIAILGNRREDLFTGEQAARALGRLRDARAIPPLLEALRTGNAHLRYAVRGALISLGRTAIPVVLPLLHDRDAAMRRWAAFTLGAMRDPRVVDPLLAALNDREPVVRQAAASALGDLRAAEAVEPLIGA